MRLLLPQLADSLAGRMEIIQLRPLAHSEISGFDNTFFSDLFSAGFSKTTRPARFPRLGKHLAELICMGGYPSAIARSSPKRRRTWYRDYITTIIQRDVRDIAKIHHIDILPRLLALAASQTARLFNSADLASPFSLSRPTIRDYLTVLEQLFLLEQLPPWHSNRLSRLIKTPKMHLNDTGLACALLGVDSDTVWQDKAMLGQLLETFIYQELRKQADWHQQPLSLFHFRNKDQVEVDIVIEQGRHLAGVEVKAAATVGLSDFKGLSKLKESYDSQFVCGVVFYDGETILPFGDKLFALPISMLTSTTTA